VRRRARKRGRGWGEKSESEESDECVVRVDEKNIKINKGVCGKWVCEDEE
jgi:hypothetical protein